MKTRIYIFTLLFVALAAFAPLSLRAGDRDGDHRQSDHRDDRKDKNNSDRNLPINTAIVALLVAGAGIGVISIKKKVTTRGI